MEHPQNTHPALPGGWIYPSSEQAESIHAQFLRELHPAHILASVPVEIFADRPGSDDILLRCKEQPERFIMVHLSWQDRGFDALHPYVEFQGTFAEFLAEDERMMNFIRDSSASETKE